MSFTIEKVERVEGNKVKVFYKTGEAINLLLGESMREEFVVVHLLASPEYVVRKIKEKINKTLEKWLTTSMAKSLADKIVGKEFTIYEGG